MQRAEHSRLSIGLPGLDNIPEDLVLSTACFVCRRSESGATALGPHFPADGIRKEEKVPFVTLKHPYEKNLGAAKALLSERIKIPALDPVFAEEEAPRAFSPGEVEREPAFSQSLKKVDPAANRVFFGGMTQIRRNLKLLGRPG